MTNETKRNATPRYSQNDVYIRSVTLANDYRLRLPMEIVEQLELDEVATLTLHINSKGQVVVERWRGD